MAQRTSRARKAGLLCLLLAAAWAAAGLQTSQEQAFAQGRTILVTGAGGRTGSIVVEKLVRSGRYTVRALVHSEKSKDALLNSIEMLNPKNVMVADITSKEALTKAFAGASAVIVVTSAVPKLKPLSLIPFLLGKLLGKKWKLKFTWKGGKPEQVDWEGQKNQFDAADEAKVKQVILVGTMTGTQKDSFLNSIGDGDGDQIVMWKRKAEMYLIDKCQAGKMKYTIIHAGGLSDDDGGTAKVSVGVDDTLREVKPSYRIPRADVAEACVQALECKEALDRSFDLGSTDAGQPLTSPEDFKAILATLEGKNCDYTINPPP